MKNFFMRRWKRFLNPNPTRQQFENAWKLIFGHDIDECVLLGTQSGINTGFTIQTPTGIICHGGFGFHTDVPVLDNPDDEWYSGSGCGWGSDKNGVRYHKLDKTTGLPKNWDEVRAAETILSYIEKNISPQPLKEIIDCNH